MPIQGKIFNFNLRPKMYRFISQWISRIVSDKGEKFSEPTLIHSLAHVDNIRIEDDKISISTSSSISTISESAEDSTLSEPYQKMQSRIEFHKNVISLKNLFQGLGIYSRIFEDDKLLKAEPKSRCATRNCHTRGYR